MVKVWIVVVGLTLVGVAEGVYERNCVPCHQALPSTLQQMFKRYLLVYSGEKNLKASIKHYLQYPDRSISVMSDLFIQRYGIKSKSWLSDAELDEAIEVYWDQFKVFGRLQ